MPGKTSGHAARDCVLVIVGICCAAPLLLLPSSSSLPRASWSDASHVHATRTVDDFSVRSSGGAAAPHADAPLPSAGRDLAVPAPLSASAPRLHHICTGSDPVPPAEWSYDLMDSPGSSIGDWPAPKCHWAVLRHPSVSLRHFNVCTHDPAVDKVISTYLHEFGFWDMPETYNTLLAAGPCSAERPYSLDIGANLGLWTLVSAVRGCKAVAFEPLSQNILRLRESLRALGLLENARLYKHAAGKRYGQVSINFFASNPGASAIGVGGAGVNTESVGSITIDGLLLGDRAKAPSFPRGPPVIGRHIGWAKIDTEGWDVAVVDGALRTLIGGKVPLIMIEFSPGDASGTAGCDPVKFVQLMYANGYRMFLDGGKVTRLASLVKRDIPRALEGVGNRVFEVFFIHDEGSVPLMQMGVLQPFDSAAEASDALIEPWVRGRSKE